MSDIIFLDIDGVLRTHKSDSEWSEKLNTPIFKRTDRLFSKKSVNDINYITSLTHAKLLLPLLRIHLSIIELNSIFKKKRYNCRSHWKTEIGLNRGEEIKSWLDENDYVTNYVVIDDQINDIITTIPKCNVVKVDPIIGFDNVDKVLDILL
jgi:hypothetical protein